MNENPPYPEDRGPASEHPEEVPGDDPERRSRDDDADERGSLDTGAPPGVHPNSDEPDPEVLAKQGSDQAGGPLHENYGAGTPPSGPDPLDE